MFFLKIDMKEIIKKYKKGIILGVLIILILIIGIFYSGEVTNKSNEKEIKIEEPKIEENKLEEKVYYKVDIKGEVKNPGVYELEENSRVVDVINKAGGLNKKAQTTNINLSKKIKDEMVIIIYNEEEIKELTEEKEKIIIKYEQVESNCVCPDNNDACIEETKNNEENSNELININEASKEQLQSIKGIGESKALAIIEYRKENKFLKIEDIKNISGIGDSLFEKIKDYITV